MSTHLDLALSVAALLDDLGIRYVVGGSVASSLFGEPRSTVDIDIAIELDAEQLTALVERVRPTFYVPEQDARRALRERDSFNLIHNEIGMKVDLFVLGDGVLDVAQVERRVSVPIPSSQPAELWVTSPEDQILRKLDWYRTGSEVSDRQLRDVTSLISLNRGALDNDYLSTTAESVGLSELLDRARGHAD